MTMMRGSHIGSGLALLLVAAASPAAQLVVGSGASMSLGSATVNAGCRDLQITGTLDIGSGSLVGARNLTVPGLLRGGTGTVQLSGDLSAATTLQPQSGTVRIADGCGSSESRVIGDHQFFRLSVQSSDAHTLTLPAGGTQAIANGLELLGGTPRMVLRSSTFGVVSFLSLASGGSQLIGSVDAVDVGAPPGGQYLAPQAPESYNSIDRGNTPRFFADQPIVPVPALGAGGLSILSVLLAAIAMLALRSRAAG
jgi:hypothetical protein